MRRVAVLSLLASVAVTGANPAEARVSVVQATQAVASNCRLEGWQFALEPNAQDLVRVELSPTLSAEQVTCVYQSLVNYDLPLDRPAPVEVKRDLIRKPNGTPQ